MEQGINKKFLMTITLVIILALTLVGFVFWYAGRETEDKNTKEYQKFQTVKKEQNQKVESDKVDILPSGNGGATKTLTPLPAGSKPIPALPN